jgi:ketosteroid isomerase-like protein
VNPILASTALPKTRAVAPPPGAILDDAMSRENVEAVYQVIDAFNRRDLDAFLKAMDPNVEFAPYERALEGGGAYVGHPGVRRWWSDLSDAIPDLRAELDEVRDLDDFTFVTGRLHGQGAGSGAAFDRALCFVVQWRNGREVWWHAFENEPEALEAVQLRRKG